MNRLFEALQKRVRFHDMVDDLAQWEINIPRGYVEWRRMFGVGQLDSENAQFDERLVVDVQPRARAIPDGFEVEEGQLTLGGIPLGPVDEVLDEMEAADCQIELEQAIQSQHKRGRG